jgi:hypothetical protein
MNPLITAKPLVTALSTLALVLGGSLAPAQSSGTTTTDSKAEAKAARKQQFDQSHKAMQEQSKSSAAGPAADASMDKSAPKNRPGGKAGMQMYEDQQMPKGSKPVDKTAKAPPRPDASKMTVEEQQEYRQEHQKDMKP